MSDLRSMFNWSRRCNLLRGRCKWAKLLRDPTGRLTYRYRTEGEDYAGCKFSLLSEVGEPYQQPFIDRLRELVNAGAIFETRDVYEGPKSVVLTDIADFIVLPGKSQVGARDATWNFKERFSDDE